MKQIVVLGGGYGGVLTAKKLAKRLKKQPDTRIVLIDKKPYHTLLTELHEVAAGRVDESNIKIELKDIFGGFRNVEVVLDNISDVDFNARMLKGERQTYTYDYLVIGTGSKPTYFGIPGADRHAFTLWSFDDAIRLREHTMNMFRQAARETDPAKRKALLTFVVVGGGFTGVEMIGELAEFTKQLARDNHIDERDVTLHLADMMPTILGNLPESLIKKSVKRLQKMGVVISTGSPITEVKEESVTVGGKEIATRTVIWTAGVEGSELMETIDAEKQGRNRIITNDKLQLPNHENVYVVGDNIFYIPEGEQRPVPQMVENAENSAPLITHNIVADLTGGTKKSYKPAFHGMMVSIGSRYGVASVGTANKKFQFSGWFAMAIKHLINIVYLIQVAGLYKVWQYWLNEFTLVKNNRSILGGHFAKRSPNIWLVPLRIFVGCLWLKEGLDKLSKVLDDPGNIFLIPAKVTDGTSGASPAADGAAEAVEALSVPDWISGIVDWSMDLMFYKADGSFTALAPVFQTGMVLAEIVIGVLLVVGLFTAPAALLSVLMGVMIWSSGMAAPEMIWYMLAGIALIGGAGSTIGLDYYVYPRLLRRWKKLRFVKRWYLYSK
jgi:NADH dehydrogenase